MRFSEPRRNERGASLILVLVFVTALSLVIGALLSGTSTAQKATTVATSLAGATYATDSGVEYGLEQLRSNEGFCPAANGGPVTVTDGTTNGTTVGSVAAGFASTDVGLKIGGGSIPAGAKIVSVSGSSATIDQAATSVVTTPGVSLTIQRPAGMQFQQAIAASQPLSISCGGDGADYSPQTLSDYAVVTLDPGNDSLHTQSGGSSSNKQVTGKMYVAGNFNLQVPLRVNEAPPQPPTFIGDGVGDVLQANTASGGCVRPSTADLTASFQCTDQAPPDPKPALPPAPGTAPAPRDIGSGATACRVFHPGKYSDVAGGTPFALSARNYLASGVYYLDFFNPANATIDMNTSQVYGGAADPSTGENQALPAPFAPCATDADASPPVVNGDKGVEIILGANTKIDVNRADAEFMAFHPQGSGQGPAGISFRTVSTSAAGYDVSTIGPSAVGLTVAGGSQPHFAVHGAVYIPNAKVEIFATGGSQAAILGGVVAWDLLLQSSASGNGFEVQVAGGRPRSRSKVVIEGTVPVSGTKKVKSRAVVDVHVTRTVNDGQTRTTDNFLDSVTALFSKADEGATVTGSGLPATGVTIASFVNTSRVQLSTNVGAGTGRTITVDPPLTRSVTNAATNAAAKTVTGTASPPFTDADVGAAITGPPNIPAGTTIVGVQGPTQVTISTTPTTTNGLTLSVTRRKIVRVTVDSWRVDNP